MKILSISAQKPSSTGSGVYLTELVKSFNKLGCQQAVVAGIYKEDKAEFDRNVNFYPVYYKTDELPFAIPGMTDNMPYESTVYSQMSEDMVFLFKKVFLDKIMTIIRSFKPDLILCHHLYLLTALVRDNFPDHKVACVCHGTDLRQIKKNSLENKYIIENIKKLDMIFALHGDQREDIAATYEIADKSKIKVIGSGYNSTVFYNRHLAKKIEQKTLIYAGKLNQKKGVMHLIKSLELLPYDKSEFIVKIAGGNDNVQEYDTLMGLVKSSKYNINVLGKLNQQELAEEFNSSDIFILPSFFEGLPLVLIEALACGLKVISTDLPGIREWMDTNIPNNSIIYVKMPTLVNIDEPKPEEVPEFEKNIAEAIALAIEKPAESDVKNNPDLKNISWDGLAQKILTYINSVQAEF